MYRIAQLRYTHIMYCTLWKLGQDVNTRSYSTEVEGKGLKLWCDITIYSPTKNKLIYQIRANTYAFWLSDQYGKYISNIFLFHPFSPSPQKCLWILCFDLLPLQYTNLTHEIWRFLVYIFLDPGYSGPPFTRAWTFNQVNKQTEITTLHIYI